LQKFLNIKLFVFLLCMVGCIEGAAVNGIVNIILTTLERQFSLPSSQSGLIVSSTDIGAVIFVLFVSFIGSKGVRPKWIGGGTFIMALGSFIFITPHIFQGEYDYQSIGGGGGNKTVCDVNNVETCTTRSGSGMLYVFMLAQFVHGIGFTPMFTLGTAYVDDNAPTESTALYLGLIYAITALGVAAGFLGGGQTLNLWVDFDRTEDLATIESTLSPMSPVWVGAWWLGFVITCIAFFIFAIPVWGYPKNLPGTKHIRESRKTDADREREEKEKNDTRSTKQKVLDFPKAIFALLRIPIYIILNFGACAETLIIGGLSAFAPKILEEKFNILPADAGLIMGAVTIGGGAGGMVLGGFLIKCLKLRLRGMLRLCFLMSFLALLVGAGFFINCPESEFAGLTNSYPGDSAMSSDSLAGTCNTDCACNTLQYEPVCGKDSITYFSACHAGCSYNYTEEGMTTTFANCSCIMVRSASDPSATSGECANSCQIVWLFVILLFAGMLFTFTTVTPASMAILRCVPDEHRALGLGLQWVMLRLLGTIPGPVLTGYVIDQSCGLWQDFCGERGSCWVYDRTQMSWRLFVWWVCVKVFSGVLFLISSCLVKEADYDDKELEMEKSTKKSVENGTTKPDQAGTVNASYTNDDSDKVVVNGNDPGYESMSTNL
ncbi:hypothetical protein FSP39_020494, partial [Pinctada imbricata]